MRLRTGRSAELCFASFLAALVTLLFSFSAQAQVRGLFERPTVIRNVRILSMDGWELERGTVIVKGDRIVELGRDLDAPLLSRKIDGTGLVLTPGLIDVHSVVGLRPGGPGAADTQRRAADAFDRYATDELREVLTHGVTSVYVGAGGAPGIGGRGAVVRLEAKLGTPLIGQVVDANAALCVDLGSEQPAVRRLEIFHRVREKFRAAVSHRESLERYAEDVADYEEKLKEHVEKSAEEDSKSATSGKKENGGKRARGNGGRRRGKAAPRSVPAGEAQVEEPHAGPRQHDSDDSHDHDSHDHDHELQAPPPRRRGSSPSGGKPKAAKSEEKKAPKKPREPRRRKDLEELFDVLDRERLVRIKAHRSSDLLNALELAREFSLRVVIEGASEAHLVAEDLATAEAAVVLGPQATSEVRAVDRRRAMRQPLDYLKANGVRCFVGSGAQNGLSSRFVLLNSVLASGTAENRSALARVTKDAAKLLGVSDQVGRIRRGLMADLVLWSGEPTAPTSQVEVVIVGGRISYDARKKTNSNGSTPR